MIGDGGKGGDGRVNAQQAKQLTNMRAAAADKKVPLAPPLRMGIEEALEHINYDELVEITPGHIRLRKLLLDEIDRRRARAVRSR